MKEELKKEFEEKANKFVGKGGLKYASADEMAIDKIATWVWFDSQIDRIREDSVREFADHIKKDNDGCWDAEGGDIEKIVSYVQDMFENSPSPSPSPSISPSQFDEWTDIMVEQYLKSKSGGVKSDENPIKLEPSIYKGWLDSHVSDLDIDCTGMINFVGTKFQNDQDARLEIQDLYDEYYFESKSGGKE